MAKWIQLRRGQGKTLTKIFRCSNRTITRALYFESNSDQAKRIRLAAIKQGGVLINTEGEEQ